MTRNDLPAITLLPEDLSRLDLLTGRVAAYRDAARRLLARELARARVLSSADPPRGLVTMRSTVRFRDDDTERIETATIVYPGEEIDVADRISVVTPRGAALIGLSEGQSIDYEADDGGAGRLSVLQVIARAEAGRPPVSHGNEGGFPVKIRTARSARAKPARRADGLSSRRAAMNGNRIARAARGVIDRAEAEAHSDAGAGRPSGPRSKCSAKADRGLLDAVDLASDESFPASDPPAWIES